MPEFEKLDFVDVARLAAPQSDVFGLPRYGDSLVIKKSAAPIWVAVTFSETLDLVARAIDLRLTAERDMVARVQQGYDDARDPKKREARLAQYRKVAAQVKDPAFMEKMTKAEAEMEKQADKTWLPQIASVKAVVTKSEQELASVRTTAAGLSAADKAAPACYASRDTVSVSRFRRAPSPGCDPARAPELETLQPGAPANGAAGADDLGLLPVPDSGPAGAPRRWMRGQQAAARVDRQGGPVGVAAVAGGTVRGTPSSDIQSGTAVTP